MGVFSLPWSLTGALLASTYLPSLFACASPSINVGLQASFSSAPYLLELLFVDSCPILKRDKTDLGTEKQLQTKTQHLIFRFSIELPTVTSQKPLQIRSFMTSLYKC